MSQNMYAWRKTKPGVGAERVSIPVPQINDNEVLVKVRSAALCRSDLDVYEFSPLVEKANYNMPFTMGHEFAGEIVEAGKAVKGYKAGDRVAGETHIPCGFCRDCRTGNQHICRNGMGVLGRNVDGCFAQYIKLHEKACIKLPDSLTYDQGSILEPLATAMHAISKAAPWGRRIGILGVGSIGQMAVDLARSMGAAEIYAMDIDPQKLDESKKRGAHVLINGMKENLTDVVMSKTEGVGLDCAIDFTGSERVINQMIASMAVSGDIVQVGMVEKPLTLENYMFGFVYKELKMTGIFGRRMYETWETLMPILSAGILDLDSYIGAKMPISQFNESMDKFRSVSGRIVYDMDWDND